MKVVIDLEKDSYETVIKTVNSLYNKSTNNDNNQSKPDTNTAKKYYCNNPYCKKEITKDVVAFCLHEENKSRFQGKVYCRDCQQKITTGGGST